MVVELFALKPNCSSDELNLSPCRCKI